MGKGTLIKAGIGAVALLTVAGTGYLIGKGGTDVDTSQPTGPISITAAETETPTDIVIRRDAGREAGSDGLQYLGMDMRSVGDSPTACLRFSEPLNSNTVIADKAYIRVSPDVPFSLQVQGRAICLLGLSEGQEQSVTVLPGFASAAGTELTAQLVEPISFDPKPAMVGFVGDGIILPRTEGALLGLKAMNADAVDLTVYRVNHRALFDQTPNIGETAVEGDWSWNSAAWNTRVEVHTDRIDLSGQVNEIVEFGYPMADIVADHGPGAYVVDLKRASDEGSRRAASSWRWLYVTDLALASYRTPDSLDVTVRAITTAQTVSDVKLTLIAANNEVLSEAQSDADGRARFPGSVLRGTGNLAPKMVLAYAGEEDFAALDLARSPLDLTAYDVTGRQAAGPIDAFLFTERGVYRPGETVYLTGLIRDASVRAAFDRDGTLTVMRPDGTEFSEGRVSPGEYAGALFRQIALPIDAARGRWTARLDLDGLDTVGSVRFSVEDFIPEQLRLDVRADDAPIIPGQTRNLTLAADFLYGAPGRGLDAEADARVQVDPNPFAQWSDYSFGDATETFREEFIPIGQGVTAEDGRFQTSIDLAGYGIQSSSPLRLFVTAGVAEPSGRYVRDSLFLPLRSEPVYVGFDPQFDGGYAKRNTPARIDLIAVDVDGERTAASGTLSLIREDYDYHWYREEGRWRYRRDRRDYVLEERTVSIGDDAPFGFDQALDYGEYRLEFVTDAGATFSYQFGSGWRRAGGDTDAPDRIEVGLSDASVSAGDRIVLSVNAPFSGVGELVVADRGVRSVQTVQIPEGESEITLPIGRDVSTDLYALLSVYTPGADAQPRRAVGLVHVPLNREAQSLEVSLDMPAKILPRTTQDVEIKVAGLDGQAAFLTLAAVDTGILQITDYSPPDPQSHYFGKLAFPIDLFDDYARMLAPFSSIDRVGGDTLGGAGLAVVPTTIVSLFEGPVQVRRGKATVTLDIPDFQGELTVMAVVWSETKIGSASAPMVVRDPVTAQLALPRFLAPGDLAVATVAMDNVDGEDGTYVATVARNGNQLTELSQSLDRGRRSEDPVELMAGPLGISTYTLAVSGPGLDVTRDYRIQTRAPSMPVTRTRFVKIEPGSDLSLGFAQDRDGLVAGTIRTRVSASFSPGLEPRALMASLQRYPYGCTEQTVSVAMPLLLSESLGSLPGLENASRTASIQGSVDRILGRQGADGAFGLWRRDDGNASPYLQLYASDFILQAAEDGFAVPTSAKNRTLAALKALSRLERRTNLTLDYNFGMDDTAPDYELRAAERAAYAMALLARHDQVKKTDLLYLDRRFGPRIRGSISQSHLGYALQAMGEADRAQAAFARAADRISSSDLTYYDSDIRNAAALLALGSDLPDTAETAALLTLQTDTPEALNTHEKAWALRAIMGRRTDGVPFRSDDAWTVVGNVASRPVETNDLAISNSEAAPIWLQISTTGLSDGPMRARSQGVTVAKSMFDIDGRALSGDGVSRGERMVVLLEAEASSRDAAMWVMADLLPAGFEIESVLSADDAGESGPFGWLGELSTLDMTEARDDRFVASWRTASRYGDRSRRVAYVLRAVTQGDFALPGVHLEDMYRPTRMATTAGSRIGVTPDPSL